MGRGLLSVKGWLAVSGVLIFAAGASLGFVAASFLGDEGRQTEEDPEPHVASADILPSVTNSKVWDLLNLGASQREQADRILNTHFQKLRHLREEWDNLGQKVESDLLALLDEGQREKMHGIIRQIKISELAGRVSQRLPEYRRELKLTVQQEDAIYPVLLNHEVERELYLRTLRDCRTRGEKVDRQVMMQAFAKMGQDLEDKMKPILSEEQLAKFKEIQKRRQAWGGEGRGRPPEKKQGPPAGRAELRSEPSQAPGGSPPADPPPAVPSVQPKA